MAIISKYVPTKKLINNKYLFNIFFIFSLAIIWNLSHTKLTGDEYAWLLIAREYFFHGQLPYSDIYENKGPILLLFYLIPAILGFEKYILILLSSLVLTITVLSFSYLIKKTSVKNTITIFFIFSNPILFYGTALNSEVLSLMFVLLGYYCIQARSSKINLTASFLFFSFAIFTNPKVLYFILPSAYFFYHLNIKNKFKFSLLILICLMILLLSFPLFNNYIKLLSNMPSGSYFTSVPFLYEGCDSYLYECINKVRLDYIKNIVKLTIIPISIVYLIVFKKFNNLFGLFLFAFITVYLGITFFNGRPSGQYLMWLIPAAVFILKDSKLLILCSLLSLILSISYKDGYDFSQIKEVQRSTESTYYFGRGESAKYHYTNNTNVCVKNYANWFIYPLMIFDKSVDIDRFKNNFLDTHIQDLHQCDPDLVIISKAFYSTNTPSWLSDFLLSYDFLSEDSSLIIYEKK